MADTTPRAKPRTQARLAGLDGLRSWALMAVIFYHLDVAWLPSGHLGVVVFLVLSGYLYTKSLVKDLQHGNLIFSKRVAKRFARLFPSVCVLILGVGLVCLISNHVLLTKMKPDMLPAAGFVLNIANIVRESSYFDNFGATSPLLHLWYLGLDMQFCLIWPCILYVMLQENKSPQRLQQARFITLGLALASAVWMAVLYDPQADPSRVYYGLDTRAFSLLLGSWLALVPVKKIRSFSPLLHMASPLCFIGLLVAAVVIPRDASLFYYGGFFVASLMCVISIAGLLDPKNPLTQLCSKRPFVSLGLISFSVYLWHYPAIVYFNAQANTTAWWIKLLVVAGAVLMGALCYLVVEKRHWSAKSLGFGALLVLALWAGSQAVADESLVPADAFDTTEANVQTQQALSGEADKLAQARVQKQDVANLPSGNICLLEDPYFVELGIHSPVLIGDSVPTALTEKFPSVFPNGLLDAKVSRRTDEMQTLLQSYLDQGVVGDVVILQAFNNTATKPEMLDQMIEACGDRKVYLVLVKIPESMEGQINDTLRAAAEKYPQVELIDWPSLALQHMGEYFWKDQTHLRPEGEQPYLELIANTIAPGFAERGGYVLSAQQAERWRAKQEEITQLTKERDEILHEGEAKASTDE